jgi:hypothetical protein
VHLREHFLVSSDHGNDDGMPKVVEFLIVHLEAWPHFAHRLIPTVFRHQREVEAELANRECLVQLSFRTIRLIEQRLRVGHKRFCNGAHVQIPPCGCTERLTIRGKAKARPLRQGLGGPRSAALFYRGDDVK